MDQYGYLMAVMSAEIFAENQEEMNECLHQVNHLILYFCIFPFAEFKLCQVLLQNIMQTNLTGPH